MTFIVLIVFTVVPITYLLWIGIDLVGVLVKAVLEMYSIALFSNYHTHGNVKKLFSCYN